jgi:membrane protease YdiL (CAAX protease family)
MEQKRMSGVGKIWWIIYPLLILLGISLVSELLVSIVVQIVGITSGTVTPEMLMDTSFDNPIIQTILWGSQIHSGIAITVVGLLIMKRDKKVHELVSDRLQGNSVLTWVSIIIISLGMIGIAGGITQLTAAFSPAHDQKAEMVVAMGNLFYVVSAVIIAPFIEEIIFRGLVFKRLRSFLGFLPAALISGAIFGILHGNIVQGLYATIIGVIFAYIYEKKQSLIVTIIAHFLVNGINALVMVFMPAETVAEAQELITGNYPRIIRTTIMYAVICAVGVLLLKISAKNTPPWQVKTAV